MTPPESTSTVRLFSAQGHQFCSDFVTKRISLRNPQLLGCKVRAAINERGTPGGLLVILIAVSLEVWMDCRPRVIEGACLVDDWHKAGQFISSGGSLCLGAHCGVTPFCSLLFHHVSY